MLIVGGVAADTGLWCLFVVAAHMARVASHCPVRAGQPEARLVMIEFSAGPTRRTVALAARLAELPAMHVVGLVAIDAVGWSLAPCYAGLVATVAHERGMRALEREVGQAVVELPTAELHDIGFAALVLGVTRVTFTDTRVGHASVIAVMLPEVAGDLFVAIETQRGLRPHIGAIVTV